MFITELLPEDFGPHLAELKSLLASLLTEATPALDEAALQTLQDHLRKSRHLLRRCDKLNDQVATLLSRLQPYSELIPLTQALAQRLTPAYLTCRQPPPDLPHPALVRTLEGHKMSVSKCVISADGGVIVSHSWDGEIKVWEAASGLERFTLTGAGHLCAISADGGIIVSALADHTLKIWDAHTGMERLTLQGHIGLVNAAAISVDGSIIVSASEDKTLKVWDAHRGTEHFTLAGHTAPVKDCAISADGTIIVSAAEDKTLKVWDAHSGSERLTLTGQTDTLSGCHISVDRLLLVSRTSRETLTVREAYSGVEHFTLPHQWPVSAFTISGDGNVIVSATLEDESVALMDRVRIQANSLTLWNAQTGAKQMTLTGHTSWVNDCAVSADGTIIVSAAGDLLCSAFDHTLKIWDTRRRGDYLSPPEQTTSFLHCASSADGAVVVTQELFGNFAVWDGYTGRQRYTLPGVWCFALSAAGSILVTSSGDNTLKVWDVQTGTEHLTLAGSQAKILDCAINADGTVVVAATYDGDYWDGNATLQVWDARQGTQRLALPVPFAVRCCALNADGTLIVAASRQGGILKVWDGQTGSERLTITLDRGEVGDLAINAAGSVITATTFDYDYDPDHFPLKVWDAQTGAEQLSLNGLEFPVEGCAISANGNLIISASWDGSFRAWDAHKGECLATLAFNWPLYDCACSADGQHIIAVGKWGIYFLRLWL